MKTPKPDSTTPGPADISEELGDFDFDPDDVLASLVPYDEPSSNEEPSLELPTLDDEKPASEFLAELNWTEAFRTVASRLSHELESIADPAQQAATALAISEIHSLAGNGPEALPLASKAIELNPASRVARMQVRHLTFDADDYQAIPALVAGELSCLTDASEKAQLHLWSHEFERVARCDRHQASQALSQANSEFSSDTQVSLLHFLSTLAEIDPPEFDRLPGPSLPLVSAESVRELLAIRGGSSESTFPFEHPAAIFLDAAAAISAGRLADAARTLGALQSIPDCNLAFRWLRSSLLSHNSETRPLAIEELLQIEQLDGSHEAHEALLERAVETDNKELLSRLVESGRTRESAPAKAAEQLLLLHLADSRSTWRRDLFEDVTNDNSLVALAVAIMDLFDPAASDFSGTDRRSRALLSTARRIAMSSPTNPVTLPSWHNLPDESDEFVSLDLVLNLEQAVANRDFCAIGHLIQGAHESSGPCLPGDRETLAALFFQAGHDPVSASAAWDLARTEKPSREAAIRALLSSLPGDKKSQQIEKFAERLELDDERAPWLLLEAALHASGTETDATQRLLEHAHAISPDLVLTMTIGEDLARNSGDNATAIDWLGKRSDLADDSAEIALLAAQEALLQKDLNPLAAETCATRAIAAATTDPSLLVLRDFVSPGSSPAEREPLQSGEKPSTENLCETAARAAWAGNWRTANESANEVWESEASEIATIWTELAAAGGQRHQKLFEKLFTQTRQESDPNIQRELYERLSRLDPNFGNDGATDLWLNAILERAPGNLAALRGLERSAARRNRWAELASISEKFIPLLDRNEAQGYSWLASVLNVYSGTWTNGEAVTEWAAQQQPVPLWALRRRYAHAAAKGDLATVYSIQTKLAERANYAGDATALRIRSAETAYQLGHFDQALAQLRAALDMTPDHLVALSMLATWQFQRGDVGVAAEAFEQVAQACSVPGHRESALSQAAELWLSIGDEARGEFALEQLLLTNPSDGVAIAKLSQIYRASHAHDRLAALLERKLEVTRDPLERMQLQVERARCLLALDLTIAADKALEPALQTFPENVEVLQMKAEISLAVDDLHEAEYTYTRLLQLVADPEKQANLYRRLGSLYERSEEKADVAESTYRRLLEIVPDDNGALTALVRLCMSRNDIAEAIRLQNQLVDHPSEPDSQRIYQIELAKIYETKASDRRKAEEILEKARRKWPNDSVVLRAFAEFYLRASDSSALQVLLERSATEARRALHTGRFEIAFFEVLATVASLRGQGESALVAEAIALALRGSPAPLTGVGQVAAAARYEETLAPELLNLPLRAMLQRTGWALDAAQPLDLRPLLVSSLSERNASLFDRIAELSRKFDLDGLTVWVSPKLGPSCIPAQCRPPVLVIGQKLVDCPNEAAREFLVVRALKTLQTHTACLARVATVDLWPLLAAYLGVFLPNWQPQAVDPKRFEQAKQNIQSALVDANTQDMPTLAQEVVLALGNKSSQVGEAANEWGSRTALMALGNPADALEALALTSSAPPLPKENPAERVKWVNRHAEARNLMIYAVSDGFLQLRSQLLRG